ncbi:hypothetical protein LRAMOSA01608 [Lichtheimia ramosa]|uniref:Uncharacterized protein n=2 Tax=Lichtheimia TaxID=688353 RepID=A0AAD7VC23_9FUNG|nr:uncharacterized protein O0I10_001989 [Lichtheimia ornata]KAJ8662296.1 hypothetical protein O0I10_001989 [Lichtheimia ornata]CDS07659.1 hypothetical protein LRAMOSA01608 [Lichtheimia ramosa]
MFLQAFYLVASSTRRYVLDLYSSSTKKPRKSVRFSGVDTVQLTHSPSEYDRHARATLRINTKLGLPGPQFFMQPIPTRLVELCS